MQRLCANLLQMHDKEDEKKRSAASRFFCTVCRKQCLSSQPQKFATEEMENWIRSWKMSIYIKVKWTHFCIRNQRQKRIERASESNALENSDLSRFQPYSAYMYELAERAISRLPLFRTKGFFMIYSYARRWWSPASISVSVFYRRKKKHDRRTHIKMNIIEFLHIWCAFVHSLQTDKIEVKAACIAASLAHSVALFRLCISRCVCCIRLFMYKMSLLFLFFFSILSHWFTERIFR